MEQEKTKDNFCDSGERIAATENSHAVQRLTLARLRRQRSKLKRSVSQPFHMT
jgi:hypothetical protein